MNGDENMPEKEPTKLEILLSLAEELGYGVYALHKQEGRKKELTLTLYTDNTGVLDIHKHRTAYAFKIRKYSVGFDCMLNGVEFDLQGDAAVVIETDENIA